MAWSTFSCTDPDFLVKSALDGSSFPVQRLALQKSDVFRDMFACCDDSQDADLELNEKSGELAALLRLLHDPPSPPTALPAANKFDPVQYDPSSVIPLPILTSVLFVLADKYLLDEEVLAALRLHLLANAPSQGLQVYGFASLHDMEWEASAASQYVLPIASYRFDEIRVIPDVTAYHRLVRLQDFRIKALRDLLLGEDIFPHGYGKCASHSESAAASWDRQRKALMGRIESATDVAGEMDALTETFRGCKTCHKACTAAVEMLAYKCKRLPRRLDQLPNLCSA